MRAYFPFAFFRFALVILFASSLLIEAHSKNNRLDSLLTLFSADKEDTSKVIHGYTLCWAYWGSGIYDSAMTFGNYSLELAKKLDFKPGISISYNNTGLIYYSQGNYSKALDYFFSALKIDEELLAKAKSNNDKELINKYKYEIARRFGNIGLVYDSQDSFDKALSYYLKALALFEEMGNKYKVCAALGNIGNVYKDKGHAASALDCYSRAIKIAADLDDQNGVERNLGNMGILYFEKGDYVNALAHFSRALTIAEEIGDQNRIPIWMDNLGSIYLIQNNFPKAEALFESALKKYSDLEDKFGMMDANKHLSDLFFKSKRFEKSLEHYKIAMALKDSLFNEEKNNEITHKELNYEFEKKEALVKADTDKQAAIAESESRKQKIIIASGGLVLLLVLLFAGFVFRTLQFTRKQKLQIEHQKELVEEKQKEILDSIHYAKRIQTALLPSEKYIDKSLKLLAGNSASEKNNYFIIYKPKDIVSGDFYYAQTHKRPGAETEILYLATADCTGHGVPGAFMSMLGVSFLNEAIVEKNIAATNEILHDVRNSLITSLNQEGSEEESKDGMDCVLCAFDFSKMQMHFTAANNPLWLLRDGILIEYKPDKVPVGRYGDVLKPFTQHTIELLKGDTIYTFTDGYADQFGGPKGKKFKYKHLQEKIIASAALPLAEQKKSLINIFDDWKGKLEQIDDVLLIAIRI